MSAQEVIEQIKHLPPSERELVNRFVVGGDHALAPGKCTVTVGDDGLPVISANGSVITSRLVRELETLTP